MEKDRYPNILMHGYTRGRQPRGRPRKRWQDNITEDCEELNLTIYQASRLANDRVKWRNTVGNKGCRSAGRGHRLRRKIEQDCCLTVKSVIVYCEIGDVYNSNVVSEVDNVSQLASSWAIKQVEEELLYYQHISDNWSIDGETYSSHSQSLCKES